MSLGRRGRSVGSVATAKVAAWLVGVAVLASPAAAVPSSAGRGAQTGLIAFSATTGSRASIFVIRPDGGGLRAVTRNRSPGGDFDPAWSPDGTRIAFSRSTDRFRTYDIWIVRVNGTGLRRLTRTRGMSEHPSWSPDGRTIAFTRLVLGRPGCYGADLYAVGVDGRGLRRIVKAPVSAKETGGAGGVSSPAWAPDGRVIAYARSRGGDNKPTDVYTVRPNGTRARRLLRNAGEPAWSADAGRLAFSRGVGMAQELYRIEAGGRTHRRLTRNRVWDGEPTWSRDADLLAFASVRARADQVYVLRAEGGAARRVTSIKGLYARSPAWQPTPP